MNYILNTDSIQAEAYRTVSRIMKSKLDDDKKLNLIIGIEEACDDVIKFVETNGERVDG